MTYDVAGRPASITDNNGVVTNYFYDPATGKIQYVKDALSTVLASYAYNADATLQSVTQGALPAA